jgi:hypothetical protein
MHAHTLPGRAQNSVLLHTVLPKSTIAHLKGNLTQLVAPSTHPDESGESIQFGHTGHTGWGPSASRQPSIMPPGMIAVMHWRALNRALTP